MAGHSQFKNIMHRKGKQDAVRSKIFSKLAREITVAAKAGLPPLQLDEFLTGERTLRSDVLDRLASAIGYQLPPARAGA